MDSSHIDKEIELLKEKIKEYGINTNGVYTIKFGELYDKTIDIFEVFIILL